eukprot:2735864-Pleurochrysis_carterae.AAC.1
MRLARVVPSVSVLLRVITRRASGQRRYAAIAREAIVMCASNQRPDLVTAPQGSRRRSCASTGELGVVQDRAAVRNESIAEGQGCKLFDSAQSEQRFRIIVGRFRGDGFTFRLAIGELLVVDVNCFQPRGQVVECGIGRARRSRKGLAVLCVTGECNCRNVGCAPSVSEWCTRNRHKPIYRV